MKLKSALLSVAAVCAFLPMLLMAPSAIASSPIDISSMIGPLDFAPLETMAASAPMIANMPIKAGGKIIPTGQPVPDLGDDADHFVEKKLCRPANAADAIDAVDAKSSKVTKVSDPGTKRAPDLADRIQTLLSQGKSFDGLNAKKVKALLGPGFSKITGKEFKAALDKVKTDTPSEDAEVATVLETIEILAVDLVDKVTGEIDVDALKAELDTDNMPGDAAIAEAITQFKAKQTSA